MKKVKIVVIAISAIFFLSSFSGSTVSGVLNGSYRVEDISLVVDEAEIDALELATGRYGRIKICPGRSITCIIEIQDADGDPLFLVGEKGKGRKNIEFNNVL
jgi:hypothetical protein